MTKVRRITQMELDGFATKVADVEEGGQKESPLTFAEIQQRAMVAKMILAEKLQDEDFAEYAELYHRLLNSNIPWKIAYYITWSTVFGPHRVPRTLDELATKVLGLKSSRQIFEWRRKYPWIEQMIADLQAEKYLEYVPGAIKASGEVASRADYKSTPERRLLLEAVKMIDKNSKITVDNLDNATSKDLLKRLDKVPTAKIIELLGADALEMIENLKEDAELSEDDSVKDNLVEGDE